MLHHHHRHGAPAIGLEPFPDFLRIIARSIHNVFTGDIAIIGVDDPRMIWLLRHARGGAKPLNPRA